MNYDEEDGDYGFRSRVQVAVLTIAVAFWVGLYVVMRRVFGV